MTPKLYLVAGLGGAAADHAIGVNAAHGVFGQRPRLADRGAEEGTIVADAGGGNIFVEEDLTAFLVQVDPGSLELQVIGLARVAVANCRGEEFEEAADGALAGPGNRRRDAHFCRNCIAPSPKS